MSLPGAPSMPRSPLGRTTSSTTASELEAMRARAWHEHGVAALVIADLADAWLRQGLQLWLKRPLAFVGLMYATFMGLGAAAYRYLYRPN